MPLSPAPGAGCAALAALFAGAALAQAARADDHAIEQVNNEQVYSIAVAPMRMTEETLPTATSAAVGNQMSGTRYLYGYEVTRTREVFGVPNWYTNFDLSIGAGMLNYTGTDIDATSGNGAISQATSYGEESVRMRVGRSFAFAGQRLAATPFVGLTQKLWLRDAPVTETARFYDEDGIEAGALLQLSLPWHWVVGADAAIGRDLGGILYNGTGNLLYASTTSFGLVFDHRTFSDWHQRIELRQSTTRFGQGGNVVGYFEPRQSNGYAVMLEMGLEFEAP